MERGAKRQASVAEFVHYRFREYSIIHTRAHVGQFHRIVYIFHNALRHIEQQWLIQCITVCFRYTIWRISRRIPVEFIKIFS